MDGFTFPSSCGCAGHSANIKRASVFSKAFLISLGFSNLLPTSGDQGPVVHVGAVKASGNSCCPEGLKVIKERIRVEFVQLQHAHGDRTNCLILSLASVQAVTCESVKEETVSG